MTIIVIIIIILIIMVTIIIIIIMSFWGCGSLGYDLQIGPSSVGALGGCLGGKSLAGFWQFQDLVCWLF